MKEIIKVSAKDSDIFQTACENHNIKFHIMFADKDQFVYEIEFKYALELYFLGQLVGLKIGKEITDKVLTS